MKITTKLPTQEGKNLTHPRPIQSEPKIALPITRVSDKNLDVQNQKGVSELNQKVLN